MDDRDWNQNQSYHYSFSGETPMEEPPRKPRRGLGTVCAILAVVFVAAVGLCMASGMSLHFNRFDSGFSLSLQNKPNQADPSNLAANESESADSHLSDVPVEKAPTDSQRVDDTDAPPANLPGAVPPPDVAMTPAGDALSLREIYAKVNPSVVSIRAAGGYSASSGSGFILSEDGYIATNAHVVGGMTELSVTLYDGSIFPAELVGADTVSDLAVLKIDLQGLIPVEFGDSDELFVGDTVVAIGDPLGIELRGTMTDGIVSAINRDLQVDGRTMTLLQTNAALNDGNSGGPLINLQGQVVGINTIKLSSSYSSIEGLGFAIPTATALPILNELMQQGYISGRPDFGFAGITVPTYAQFYYRLPAGVYIEEIDPDSDAAEKGLLPGDVLTRVDGQIIGGLDDLERVKNTCTAGQSVELVIYRRGTYYSVEITLGEATPD